MTRKEYQQVAGEIAIILLTLMLIAIGMSSCGPAWHLQRSEHHLQRAIDKGAKVKKDTVTFHFKSPEIKFNTTLEPIWIDGAPIPLWKDTLLTEDKKTGAKIKAKITQDTNCPDSCNQIKTVYLAAEVPPQDQSVDVPCETVKAGYTKWDLIIFGLAMIPGGWLIMTFLIVPLVRRLRR